MVIWQVVDPRKIEKAKIKQKKFLEKQKKLEAILSNKKMENQQNDDGGVKNK